MKAPWLLLFLCAACANVIDASAYDRKCVVDGDCAPVYQGDPCAGCLCPNAAVSQAVVTRYQADLASHRAQCGPLPAVPCPSCARRLGLCAGGLCSTRPE